MENLRTRTQDVVMELLEQLENEPAGSDASKVIAENAAKLYDVCIRDYTAEEKILDNDIARQKVIAETKKINKDLEDKPKAKWYEQIDVNTAIPCGAMVLTTVLVIGAEAGMHITFPNRLTKFIPMAKIH